MTNVPCVGLLPTRESVPGALSNVQGVCGASLAPLLPAIPGGAQFPPTHLLGLWSAISLEKSHMRPREEARTFSLANLWSHFCCIIVCNAGTAQVTIPFRHCKWSWVESFPSSPTGSAGRRWSPPWFSISLLQPLLLQDVKRYQLLMMISSALCHKWHCFPAIKPGQSEIVMPDRSL